LTVKRRTTLVLTIIAGLLVFLGVLVLYLPASWFASMLPPQMRCGELGGSIWQGECLGLDFQGARLGDATWNFAPGGALAGRLRGDIDVRGDMANARADVDLKFNGSGELRNVTARFPLDPAFVAQFPRTQRGTVVADLKQVVLADGPALAQLSGTIEVHELRQVGANPLALGSYRLTFDGAAPTDGATTGQLRDLGGPFAIEGTVTLTPPNSYLVQGFITGRSADAERLVREITLGASPDASGRSAFSFEGTY
jgi:general secretion pathway protein N